MGEIKDQYLAELTAALEELEDYLYDPEKEWRKELLYELADVDYYRTLNPEVCQEVLSKLALCSLSGIDVFKEVPRTRHLPLGIYWCGLLNMGDDFGYTVDAQLNTLLAIQAPEEEIRYYTKHYILMSFMLWLTTYYVEKRLKEAGEGRITDIMKIALNRTLFGLNRVLSCLEELPDRFLKMDPKEEELLITYVKSLLPEVRKEMPEIVKRYLKAVVGDTLDISC